MSQPLEIVAHRGYSALYPENTIMAYAKAFDAGAFAVEADVRQSAEGTLVCFHDATLERLTGEPIAVRECSMQELQRRLAPTHPLCLLRELLAYCAKNSKRRVLLDVKDDVLSPIAAMITQFSLHDSVIVGVRSLAQAAQFRRLDTQTTMLGFLSDYEQFPIFLEDRNAYPRFWEIDLLKDPSLINLAQERPCWIMAGAPSPEECGNITPERLQYLRQAGIYAVLVNDPALSPSRTQHIKEDHDHS